MPPTGSPFRIPFTTTGLSLAVNEAYVGYSTRFNEVLSEKWGLKNITEFFTVHQLYRYTLVQFEYKCSLVSPSNSFPNYVHDAKDYPKNIECLVQNVNSFGQFTEEGCEFLTVAPPTDLHSPHTVRITNLRAIVERLSKEGDKDFMVQNTLPGARYDTDGVLQNPDDIMPPGYDTESFQSDAYAVDGFLLALWYIQCEQRRQAEVTSLVGICQFSKKGACSSLVSTALAENGPYDSISSINDGIQRPTHCEPRDWYSIHPIFGKNIFSEGIELYCGVWSKKLEKLWPLVKVRYPASSKQVILDRSWASKFRVYHHLELDDMLMTLITADDEDEAVQPVICRVPYTTTGLSFAVNDLYVKYQRYFSNCCTIHQLYRYTLVQFEFQCYVVGRAERRADYYPYYDSTFLMYDRLDSSSVIRASYAENFKTIVAIIDSYGYFRQKNCYFCNIPPPVHVHHPDTIQLSNLRAIVEELATAASDDFKNGNTLPGAHYNVNGLLQNADEIMPADYDVEAFLSDTFAVHRAFRKVASRDKSSVNTCRFSDQGQPSTLVSTSVEGPLRDSIPHVLVNHKKVIARTSVKSRPWHSMNPVNDNEMNLGITLYCGVWSKTLEKKWPDMKVRNPASGKQYTTKTWNAEERFIKWNRYYCLYSARIV